MVCLKYDVNLTQFSMGTLGISGVRGCWMTAVTLCIVLTLSQLATVACEAEEKTNGSHSDERYPLVVFDFERVELPYIICLWVLIASLAKIGFHLYHKLPATVPESCLLIILGLILGAILHFTHVATTSEYVLDANIFFIYLLPPIIFDAGYFMPIRPFFDNIGSVLILAVVNTLINTVLIGLSLFAVSLLGWVGRSISLLHCLIFSALISAVDPVAVISVFEEVHVNQMLYILVFGESLLNDGVTVVLYHMMEGFIELGEENLLPIDVVTGCGSFFIIALGGSLIGILFGLFGGFITKYTEHVKVIEPLFVFVLGYLMYLTSEMCHLSGILALSFGGIVLRHYIELNVSKTTATTIKYFMKMLANISETVIFMFLGLSTMVDTLDWNLSFIFFALLFCIVYRVLGVSILAWFLNRRRLIKLTRIDQFIMAFGGLRGGIAFCLSLSLEEELVPEKKIFITATIIIIFFTVFIQGITIKPVVNSFKVKKHEGDVPTLNEKIHETLIDHLMAGMEELSSHSSHNLWRTKFRRFNNDYLRPLLSREKPKAKMTKIVNVFHTLNEQDALRSAESMAKLSTIPNGSTIDLYHTGDHSQALIPSSSPSKMPRMGRRSSSVVFTHALDVNRPSGVKFKMNKKYSDGDMVEFVHYRKPHSSHHRETLSRHHGKSHSGHHGRLHSGHNGKLHSSHHGKSHSSHHGRSHSSPTKEQSPSIHSEESCKEKMSQHSSSSSDEGGVTINFPRHNLGYEDNETDHNDDTDHIEIKETLAETVLPWKDSSVEPSPTYLSDSFPNNEPVIAHVPSWVNNLSYSHITETGSPYVSPQTTLVPKREDNRKAVFSLFSDLELKSQTLQNACEQFPAPWAVDIGSDCPQVSPMVTESGERSCDFLNHDHMSLVPDHHHVILPTNELLDEKEGSVSHKNQPHTLTEVASAPDIQHWKPIKVRTYNQNNNNLQRLQSESVLSELAFQEKVRNRVQQWLINASNDEENDADSEDVDENDHEHQVEDDVESIELELDLEMQSKIAMQSRKASLKSKH